MLCLLVHFFIAHFDSSLSIFTLPYGHSASSDCCGSCRRGRRFRRTYSVSLLFVLQKAGLICIFQQRYTPWRTGTLHLSPSCTLSHIHTLLLGENVKVSLALNLPVPVNLSKCNRCNRTHSFL